MIDPVNIEEDDDEEITTINPFSGMEDQPDVEEIVLGNEFDETESVIIPRKTNHEYAQISKYKGINRFFKIFNDVYMHQSIKSFRNKNDTETRINLTYINAEPKRGGHFAWKWLFNAYITGFVGAILFYVGGLSGLEIAHPYMLPIGVVLITIGLVSTMLFYYRTQDKMIYQSLVGQVPLIELFNRPNDDEYQLFTDTLKSHIKEAQQRMGLNMKQRLKLELSDLRRLSEEGVITVEAYEQARGLIFKHEEYQ